MREKLRSQCEIVISLPKSWDSRRNLTVIFLLSFFFIILTLY